MIGLIIYNNSKKQDEIVESVPTMQIETFNNQFEGYKGHQTGSQVSILIGRLIANLNNYRSTNEFERILAIEMNGFSDEDDRNIIAEVNNEQDYDSYYNNME